MLIDIVPVQPDSMVREILSRIGGDSISRLAQGIYLCSHWNFNLYLPGGRSSWEEYPSLDELPTKGLEDYERWHAYGVCDSPKQFKQYLGKLLEESPRIFVVSLTCVRKTDQPENGGWRWHKWGPYIGNQEPQAEYLYDEPKIKQVYTYHIYWKRS